MCNRTCWVNSLSEIFDGVELMMFVDRVNWESVAVF
jgi:hypothetical protein